MATILLSAAGAAAGASIGGSALGVSAAVLGRAAGATVGRLIDAKILGAGSPAVDVGRVDRFRLTGASEGAAIPQVHGRIRVAGQVVWASEFVETATTRGGGKGAPSVPKTTSYSYSVSLAIALCEGVINRIGRIWADGTELSKADFDIRVYRGDEAQLPDPKIEAVEGPGLAPAFRGIAYAVFEDLDLGRFGNRVPQFTFEVVRSGSGDTSEIVKAVCLIPGTGEYALATTPVHFDEGQGRSRSANVNTPLGETDFQASLDALTEELPNCRSTALVVSWFGEDLRCGSCSIHPKVEQGDLDGVGMAWTVSGMTRSTAQTVPSAGGRSVYGGTPSDQSVIEAIRALTDAGQDVMFYPFVLMEQMEGNSLPDPWTGGVGQAVLPWRGRITTSLAPGVPGSPDGTAAAQAEVAAFFGSAVSGEFSANGETVTYSGSDGFSYRRFILHYAALCAQAGGVSAFCIGSELRGLTQIRGENGSFPAVQEMRELASEVRALLGPGVRIGYAADWSEYFGYHPQDGTGDVYFHLDPLWADPQIDFVGIDNYMPLSDWRDGEEHADASWGTIHNLEYLKKNVAGGEGYDWYYRTAEAEALQLRSPIEDGAFSEPWIYRYKDIRGWWENSHHERINGARSQSPTAWVPGSKPVWFTEIGCAAIDRGTNQPNKFLDAKSSESSKPKYSLGARDDLIQMQYLRALSEFWDDPSNNPEASAYAGRMVDTDRMFVWAWDARPHPHFPANSELWGDGENYARGHWLSGRAATRSLASVISEICGQAGVERADTENVFGLVRGYRIDGSGDPRAVLQPLLLAAGIDAVEAGGELRFRNRSTRPDLELCDDDLAVGEAGSGVTRIREARRETPGKVAVTYWEADGSYELRSSESVFPESLSDTQLEGDLPIVLTQSEGEMAAERWLSEARVGRERIRFALPPSRIVRPGDVVEMKTREAKGRFRIDRIETAHVQLIEAVRIAPGLYDGRPMDEVPASVPQFSSPMPIWGVMLDLPLLSGQETPDAPHVVATADPWPGGAALYVEDGGGGWRFVTELARRGAIGETLNDMPSARPASWDRGEPLLVRVRGAALSSISDAALFSGGNIAFIGGAASDAWEVIQFRDAELVGPDTWALSMRLRGQRGTEAIMPGTWNAGSTIVFADAAMGQISLGDSEIGLERRYRIGPSGKPVDHFSYRDLTHVSTSVGQKPFAPTGLAARRQESGDISLTWQRRSRVGVDGWGAQDVPIGETFEAYRIDVRAGGVLRRQTSVSEPGWIYTAAQQASDGISGDIELAVAQISDRFGPGHFRSVTFHD